MRLIGLGLLLIMWAGIVVGIVDLALEWLDRQPDVKRKRFQRFLYCCWVQKTLRKA